MLFAYHQTHHCFNAPLSTKDSEILVIRLGTSCPKQSFLLHDAIEIVVAHLHHAKTKPIYAVRRFSSQAVGLSVRTYSR